MGLIKDTIIRSLPGLSLAGLTQFIRDPKEKPLARFQEVVFHVGPVDIGLGNSVHSMLWCYNIILEQASQLCSNVLFSIIIHRKSDYDDTKALVKGINTELVKWCAEQELICVSSFKPFLYKSRPIPGMFTSIGVSLSSDGTRCLTRVLQHALSPRNAGALRSATKKAAESC